MRIIPRPVKWFGLGAATAFLFDPDRGHTRRIFIADKVSKELRRLGGRVDRRSRDVANRVQGLGHEIGHHHVPPDDRTLVDTILSQTLGPMGDLESRLKLEAEDGVVVVRGEVRDDEEASKVQRAVKHVDGVAAVVMLVHRPGEPPPNKAEALEASARARAEASPGDGSSAG